MVEFASVIEMGIEDEGAEVADGGFIGTSVKCNFGAEVGTVDDADVVLWAAYVARVFKGDPGVAGLKEHFEQAFPKFEGGEACTVEFTFIILLFVGCVFFLKGAAVEFVEFGNVVGAEEGPGFSGFKALHEQVRDPVSGVHVVRAPAVVTGVAA